MILCIKGITRYFRALVHVGKQLKGLNECLQSLRASSPPNRALTVGFLGNLTPVFFLTACYKMLTAVDQRDYCFVCSFNKH